MLKHHDFELHFANSKEQKSFRLLCNQKQEIFAHQVSCQQATQAELQKLPRNAPI